LKGRSRGKGRKGLGEREEFVQDVLKYCPPCIEDGKEPLRKLELISLSNYFSLCLSYGCRKKSFQDR
jgi:hypothetical protein